MPTLQRLALPSACGTFMSWRSIPCGFGRPVRCRHKRAHVLATYRTHGARSVTTGGPMSDIPIHANRIVLRDMIQEDLPVWEQWLMPGHRWQDLDAPYLPKPSAADAPLRGTAAIVGSCQGRVYGTGNAHCLPGSRIRSVMRPPPLAQTGAWLVSPRNHRSGSSTTSARLSTSRRSSD